MLKSYEVTIENGQINWLGEQPNIQSTRAIITLLQENSTAEENTPVITKAKQAAQKLAEMGGTQPDLQTIPRRRAEVES